MKHTIQLKSLTTGYKDKIITRNINATLYAGELTCLLGPNGAGKSTLLKTLCTFIPPISGEIIINGTLLSSLNSRQLAQSIGVVLTERPTAMNMTVEELVGMGRSPYTGFWGTLNESDRKIVAESIAMVGIENLRNNSVTTLSDGERQKAMIAKALAQCTPIIFLDEPTAFLDYPSKVEIMKLLFRIAKEENKTVFMSTHDIELALQIADKIWLLDKKLGLKIGIPEDLAYDGSLANYFESDGLKFDRSTGSFKITHSQNCTIGLQGDGPLFRLVDKALHRIGYATDSNANPVIIVEEDGNSIRFADKIYTDIEHLIQDLFPAKDL